LVVERLTMKSDSTDRNMDRNKCTREHQSTFESSSIKFICDCVVEFTGEKRNNGLINDQSQPVQTEVADAGDDHRVLYAIDKTPPSRTAKTREVKEPKSYCSQQVRGPDHQTYPHSHGV
jgi:hypothetical protein